MPAAAASPDTTITIAAPKANGMTSPTTQPADNSSTCTRGLILGVSGVVALIAALGFAAWRRGRDVTDD